MMSQPAGKREQAAALSWSLLGDLSRQGVTFGVSIVLARVLDPADFGLVGMVMAFIMLLNLLVDGGFTTALIQREEASGIVYDSVFYYNLGVALLVAAGLIVAAPVIASFYGDDRVTVLVRVLAVVVPVNALGLVPQAVLRRRLAFKALGIRNFFGGLIGGLTGVTLALTGWGVFALVGQTLVGALASVVAVYPARYWFPRWRFSLPALREVSVFSRYVFFGRVVGQAVEQTYSLVIGKLFLPATLGFFTRAGSLSQLVIRYSSTPLIGVYLPVLSRLQKDKGAFEQLYLKVTGVISWSAFLLTGVLLLGAELLVVTLFGEKWLPSVLIFQFLIVRAFAYPVNAMMINAYLARGLSRTNFLNSFYRNAFRVVPLLVAWRYGFDAFLYTMAASTFIGTLFNLWLAERDLGVAFRRQFRIIFRWLLVGAIAFLPAAGLFRILEARWGGAAGALFACTAMGLAVYLPVYFIISWWVEPEAAREGGRLLRKAGEGLKRKI